MRVILSYPEQSPTFAGLCLLSFDNHYWQVKLLELSISPVPLYLATLGYSQSRRVRLGCQDAGTSELIRPEIVLVPVPLALACTKLGEEPFSTQFTRGSIMSNWSAAGPPEQWPIPGTG